MGCVQATNRRVSSTSPTNGNSTQSTGMGSQGSFVAKSKRRLSGIELLKSNYKISPQSRILGAGTFGKVFLSESILDSEFQVAVKVVNKEKLKGSLELLKEEVGILSRLDHPNIVRYYETFDDVKYMYIVMEYCNGGELLDRLTFQERKAFTEAEAARIMKKLFRAINHCHASGVIHRDIKPENIMYGRDGEVKLIDFGLSKIVKSKNSSLKTMAGTPFYMAPEVIKGEYTSQCDVWSLGVLMYFLLCGFLPFQGDNRSQIFDRIKNGSFHFNFLEFELVSHEAKALIRKLLVNDPAKRITPEMALKDPWFQKYKHSQANADKSAGPIQGGDRSAPNGALDPSVLNKLREFRGVSTLKKAALNIMVKMISDSKDIQVMRDAFIAIDKNQTGYITASDLQQALQLAKLTHDSAETSRIIKEVDYQGKNRINYTEFLAATVSIQKFLTNERMITVFKQFDRDDRGMLTPNSISMALEKLGTKVSRSDVKDIMKKHDS